jgi:hypothetical protein
VEVRQLCLFLATDDVLTPSETEWIRDASRQWPQCEFVGMDLVLIHRGQLGDVKKRAGVIKEARVSWVKGDL